LRTQTAAKLTRERVWKEIAGATSGGGEGRKEGKSDQGRTGRPQQKGEKGERGDQHGELRGGRERHRGRRMERNNLVGEP